MKKIEKDKKFPSSLRHLFVKVMCEETHITLAVDPNDSIANLKSMIKVKKGFPVDEQRIVYNGRNLEDDRTVSEYTTFRINQPSTWYSESLVGIKVIIVWECQSQS